MFKRLKEKSVNSREAYAEKELQKRVTARRKYVENEENHLSGNSEPLFESRALHALGGRSFM